MDNKQINLTLTSNNKTVQIGSQKTFELVEIEGLESSDFEISTSENATYDGSSIVGNRIQERLITFTAECTVADQTELLRQQMIGFFNPRKEMKLAVDYCGVKRWIKGRVRSFKNKQENLYDPFQFLVILLCPDPFFRGEDFHENMAGKWPLFASNFAIPSGGAAFSMRIFKQETTFTNNGHNSCGLVLTFAANRGSVTNPAFYNLTTGEFVRILVTMELGDILTVNTNQGQTRIELNGVNISNKKDRASRYFKINQGTVVLKYDADDGYTNLDVYLKWSQEFLGV
ncbi:phage tail family protein [Eubacteriaceae bacterium ES2]|nr:phage tail family protein [Eubacteriaceae bacterium ES2]